VTSIAYVTTTFPTLAAFVEGEVHRLRARGVRVRVFTLRGVSREHQPEHQALLAITEPLGGPLDARAWLALARWMLRRPGVLVGGAARMLWASRGSPYALAGHLAWLPAAARLAERLEQEDLERVHGAWAHFPASVAWLASRLTGRRFSMAAHAGADLYRTQAFLAEKARAAEFTTVCVARNAVMLRALAGRGARVETLYHGVDLTRFDGGARARDAAPLLLAVGRLSVSKGFDDAVMAIARLAGAGLDPRLVIVGDGPERAALEALAQEHGIAARVRFAGALTHDGLLPLYRSAWLLLAPSKVTAHGRRDGIPNVVVEAMAMGVPCVGTRATGVEEAIVAGETGELCDAGDPASLAAAIEPLLRDPARVDRMGAAARARARAEFDAARSFERLWELFGAASESSSERATVRVG
jgi:glycosyltransferase involved in cell wall biosynthesis